jgi:hypothetical protein
MMTISRDEVIRRAQTLWPFRGVKYSMDVIRDGWRTDCSGFVSMCWNVPISTPGFFGGMSTVTFVDGGLVRPIGKDELKRGDAVGLMGPDTGGAGGHVVIFEDWADPQHRVYLGWEQAGGKSGPDQRKIRYPYDDDHRGYTAWRYRDIADPSHQEDRMYHQQLLPGQFAVTMLLFPFSMADSPAFSIGTETQPGTNPPTTRAKWRVMLHVAGKGWQSPDGGPFIVTDSQDGRRRDIACPKETDRASIQRIPVDDHDPCVVPAAALAWW